MNGGTAAARPGSTDHHGNLDYRPDESGTQTECTYTNRCIKPVQLPRAPRRARVCMSVSGAVSVCVVCVGISDGVSLSESVTGVCDGVPLSHSLSVCVVSVCVIVCRLSVCGSAAGPVSHMMCVCVSWRLVSVCVCVCVCVCV